MWMLVALALFLQTAVSSSTAQTVQPPATPLDAEAVKALATEPGVYVATPNKTPALARLTGSVSDGVKTSTGLGGLMKMKSMLKLTLKEGRAPVRLSDQPTFYFVGKVPELYQFVRLVPKGKTREMNLGEIRTIFDTISSDFPDRIPLSVTPLASDMFQATVASPLLPGEYAVVEKLIVPALSSSDRKAGGPFVLGVGLDGQLVKKP